MDSMLIITDPRIRNLIEEAMRMLCDVIEIHWRMTAEQFLGRKTEASA